MRQAHASSNPPARRLVELDMPEKKTIERARREKREGKAPTTQAGAFVQEEMEHIREGKHGARNPKQAIAIGLSKARRAGVELPPPKKGTTSERTRRQAKRDVAKGKRGGATKPSRRRSRASTRALKREGRSAASKSALSRQAKSAAARRKRRGTTTPRARATSTRSKSTRSKSTQSSSTRSKSTRSKSRTPRNERSSASAR